MHSMMLFSASEYAERLKKARALMQEQGMDALLVSTPNNLVWISGYRTNLFDSNFRPFLTVIPREGEPTLILPLLELGVGQECSWMDDIRAWGTVGKGCMAADGVSALKVVMDEKKLGKAKVGVERGFGQRMGFNLDQFRQIEGMYPGVEWLDSTPLFWKLRMEKSKKELEYLREANRITDAAYEAVVAAAKPGMTERQLQGIMGSTYMLEGGDYRGFIIVQSGPERYKMMNPYATDRKIQRGDAVTFDFGAVYNGYWSDLTRTFFVGSATDRQKEFYAVALESSTKTVKAVKPGMTCEAVDQIAEKVIVDRGYKDFMLHRTGHSIGLEVHELPSVGLGDKTVIKPNMTMAIEPGIYEFDGAGGYRIEDIIMTTDSGAEYLSNCRRELTVV